MRNPERSSSEKRRRHGYRGYGSPIGRRGAAYGGAVHWGRGFTGVAFPEIPSPVPEIPTAELLENKNPTES
jgi:hypothetical protein